MGFTHALFPSWILSFDRRFESHMSHWILFSGQDLSMFNIDIAWRWSCNGILKHFSLTCLFLNARHVCCRKLLCTCKIEWDSSTRCSLRGSVASIVGSNLTWATEFFSVVRICQCYKISFNNAWRWFWNWIKTLLYWLFFFCMCDTCHARLSQETLVSLWDQIGSIHVQFLSWFCTSVVEQWPCNPKVEGRISCDPLNIFQCLGIISVAKISSDVAKGGVWNGMETLRHWLFVPWI